MTLDRVPRATAVLAALLLGTFAAHADVPPTGASGTHHEPPPPNIPFVLADDLDVVSLAFMPQTLARVAGEGTTFDRYLVNNSLCCPSRATILRGQYAHGTGVESNRGTHGGFERAYATGIESRTIATRLQRAGYRTGLFGKYLNGYPNGAAEDYVPAGWTTWASPVAGNPYAAYGYVLNENHVLTSYGMEPAAYGTDVYVGITARFIENAARDRAPFFAYLAVFAPHAPATPAPADMALFPDARAPRTPSFDQADASRMIQRALARRLAALRGCRAERCRRVESLPLRRARDAS